MTKPPYPIEVLKYITCSYFDDSGYCKIEEDRLQSLFDSIDYWLTPRKCSEVAPVFPCLMWDKGTGPNEWELVTDHFVLRFADPGAVQYTHWLPLPPAPEET